MDTQSLLKSLKDHKVKFVVIGATAFPVHGYSRATLDIDIFINPERPNAEKTLAALVLQQDGHRTGVVETDIHPFVKGVSFDRVWKNKVKAKFGNIFVWFASLDDLIKMKQAAGRPKDIEDLKYLLKLKDLKR